MLKKLITLILSYQLTFGFVVTDPASYVYFMQQIQQMTEMINKVTTQIETLGGIRTALDETKRQIYNAKDNLEGAFSNLQDSLKDLKEATSNAEIKSLFDMSRDSISTNSTEGILYKDITQEIQSYFDSADNAIMKNFDQAKLQAFDEEMKKINATLSSNSLEEARENLNRID
jgi:small-conductance mechanosensitive channel